MADLTRDVPAPEVDRALRILARSVCRELRAAGYERADLVAFANAVLDLVREDLSAPAARATASSQAAE